MTPYRSLFFLLVFLLSPISHAVSRITVELNSAIDLLTKNASGDYVVVEELAPETILRFRTDTKVGEYYRHILILSSPNLSNNEVARINQKKLFISDEVRQVSELYQNSGSSFDARTGRYDITNQSQRRELVERIIQEGPARYGSTLINMANGSVIEVLNDHVTLSDGTYVPFTFPEAKRMAREWGYDLPNASEAYAIADYAARSGNQFRAITRTPNNNQMLQLRSMNEMMNDARMRQRAQAGQNKLIDGHFKWYTNTGRIYGFARGDGRFWQNSPSAAHVGDPGYYDYSHGVRLIKRR
jgi:hypothetical protein